MFKKVVPEKQYIQVIYTSRYKAASFDTTQICSSAKHHETPCCEDAFLCPVL